MSKPAKADPATDPLIPLFTSIGLSKAKAIDAVKSPKNAAILKDIIETHPTVSHGGLDDKRASLIVALAASLSKSSGIGHEERNFVIDRILQGDLKSVEQVNGEFAPIAILSYSRVLAAVKYTETHKSPIDTVEFERSCGIGMCCLVSINALILFLL